MVPRQQQEVPGGRAAEERRREECEGFAILNFSRVAKIIRSHWFVVRFFSEAESLEHFVHA